MSLRRLDQLRPEPVSILTAISSSSSKKQGSAFLTHTSVSLNDGRSKAPSSSIDNPIVRHGAAWFAAIGTEKSKGTKVFALAGRVENTGLIEVPMGITLREII